MINERDEEHSLVCIRRTFENDKMIDIKDDNFKKVMFLYNAALKEIKTKVEILQDEFKYFYDCETIEYITTRIKKPESIIEKLRKKNYPLTYENMFEKINDIAGIRIVCNFKDDVYKIVKAIEGFQDIRILNRKDFMKSLKKADI